MIQRLKTAAVFLILFASLSLAQGNPFSKFKQFKEVAPGIDFYASDRSEVEPFVKAVVEARQRMGRFLGDDVAKGAVFICSTLEQKDSVFDQRAFKSGYKWYLTQLTPEAQRQERMIRMQQAAAAAGAAAGGDQAGQGDQAQSGRGGRSSRGGQGNRGDQTGAQAGRQGGAQDRGARGDAQGGRQGGGPGGFAADREARAATTLASQIGYAILMTSLNNEKPFRVSRLDDMSRSPLNDWLDIALVAYATGTTQNSYRTLQERMDEVFPLDDALSMSRPFVAQQDQSGGGGGGGGMGGGGFDAAAVMGGGGRGGGQRSGDAAGGAAAPGGRGGTRVLPKDVADRLVFDAQASAFFEYLIEKTSLDKVIDLVQQNRKKTETLQVVMNLLGPDVDKIEQDWLAWVKAKPADAVRNAPQAAGPSR